MASFINAQRWATGVKTHKTLHGDFVVCTGTECLGCFPEDNPGEAEELGVCEVDMKNYPFRTFLNDDYFEARLQKGKQTDFQQDISTKTKQQSIYFKNKHDNSSEDKVEEDSLELEQQEIKSSSNDNDETEKIPDNTRTSTIQGLESGRKQNQENSSELLQMLETKHTQGDMINNGKTGDIYDKLNALGIRVSDRGVTDINSEHPETKETLRYGIHFDELPFLPPSNRTKRHLPAFRNIIGEDLYQEKNGNHANALLKKMGENCRCIFFAIEYYGHSRKLPSFKMTEIVEQLSQMIDVEDIKCVQTFYDIWHVVVKTPAAARVLVTKGVILRGRHYTLVQDADSYLDIVG